LAAFPALQGLDLIVEELVYLTGAILMA